MARGAPPLPRPGAPLSSPKRQHMALHTGAMSVHRCISVGHASLFSQAPLLGIEGRGGGAQGLDAAVQCCAVVEWPCATRALLGHSRVSGGAATRPHACDPPGDTDACARPVPCGTEQKCKTKVKEKSSAVTWHRRLLPSATPKGLRTIRLADGRQQKMPPCIMTPSPQQQTPEGNACARSAQAAPPSLLPDAPAVAAQQTARPTSCVFRLRPPHSLRRSPASSSRSSSGGGPARPPDTSSHVTTSPQVRCVSCSAADTLGGRNYSSLERRLPFTGL